MKNMRTAHLAHDTHRDGNGPQTLCGEPWEPWQAPGVRITNEQIAAEDDYATRVLLRADQRRQRVEDERSSVRQCQACLKWAMQSGGRA